MEISKKIVYQKKSLLVSIAIFSLCSCVSSSKKSKNIDNTQAFLEKSTTAETTQPEVADEESGKLKDLPTDAESTKPKVPVVPSQYASLVEAIETQNDEKIYLFSSQILIGSPTDLKALNSLAMYHHKKGHFDVARFLLSKAIAAHPKTAELYSNLGVVQLAQGEKRDAINSFRKALSIDNNESTAAVNLGSIYVQEKDFQKAQVVLEIAINKDMKDLRVLNNYAITLGALGKNEKAEQIYKNLLQEDSSKGTGSSSLNKEVLYNYALLLVEHMAKYQEGLEVLNRLKFVGGPADSRNKIIALENKAKAGLK